MMIEVKNLNYIYQKGTANERRALFDISMTVPDGSLNAFIGHTGSGKSTLIQHFNALLRPESGKIIIDGEDITDKKTDLREIRKKVGLVFQYPEYQLFEETVEKDIAFGPKNLGLSGGEIKTRVKQAAELMGISEKNLKKSPFDLSGGEKRRAAIAGVLAMFPRVLILDEPTAGLDPGGRDNILGIIKRLHSSRPEMIIIFVSHSMEDVAKTAENIYVFNNGSLAMEGAPSEVFSRAAELEAMGLNVPQITRLAERLRSMGYDLPRDIYTVEYAEKAIKKLIISNRRKGQNTD
ncbi:MAG: energy-coupling factor transporter ATPase [Firmicutes bacterium]|nr:energy-coupling factor transporter ATPase [Bacillota bacterium]